MHILKMIRELPLVTTQFKTKQNILLILLDKNRTRAEFIFKLIISFTVNTAAKQTIATSAYIEENFRTNLEPLLIFNWKEDHTVEEKT